MANIDPQLLIDFNQRLGQAEQIIEEAIRVELRETLKDVESRRDALEVPLLAAHKALESPQAAVKVIEDDIAKAENEIAARVTYAGSDDMGDRVKARALIKEWQVEVENLQDKRAEAVIELGHFEADYNRVLGAWQNVDMEVQFLELNIATPFWHLGQATQAFRMWMEYGGATLILLNRDESHPAYEAAKGFLADLCHKNEVYVKKLDSDKLYRDMWDDLARRKNEHISTVHNTGDGVENVRTEDRPGYVDDYRGPSGFTPPAPRERNWRDVPMINPDVLRLP